MTDKAIAASPKGMGRPKLDLVTTTVRLPEAVLKRIDALLGEHRRSVFIREAVEAELARRVAPPTPEVKPAPKRRLSSTTPREKAKALVKEVRPHATVPTYERKPFNPQPKTGKKK